MSPTDKRGRVHTSTVTVSVIFGAEKRRDREIPDSEFSVRFYSGTGSGGQRRNKVMSCCTVTHIPTGLTQNANGRSRIDNETEAKLILRKRVADAEREGDVAAIGQIRSEQVGSGMRGDKRRTYRFQDNSVHDHVTDRKVSCQEFMKGSIDKLWK